MAESKLYEFLRELNDDSNKLTEFENDPEAAMTAAGLTNEEKEVVKSGDEEQIMRQLGAQDAAQAAFRVIRIRNIRIRFGV
ncbi:hypothetical protein QNJ95_44205 [Bradyrhizobium elkanii]|uniref:hypothetical protein n=1 Tax=Bradyrhizobium elkanii TaxID=29448 RepID=UPI002711F916|nr:hypothetical protein [Bradyrhizobium elkanii]WLA39759.1 hypothetical protein QNJ95_44205 [Bradyrhizobium elkanii]